MTYYEILNILPNSSNAVIKAAYKDLAKKYHPDVSSDENAEEKFKMINEAYSVLSNQELRSEYDKKLNSLKYNTHIVSTVAKKPKAEKASIIPEDGKEKYKPNRKSTSNNSFSTLVFIIIVVGVIWFFNKNDIETIDKPQAPDASVAFFLDNCKNYNYKKIQNYADNDKINGFVDDILIVMYDLSVENEGSGFLRDLLSSFEYEVLNVEYIDDIHSNVTVYISSCDFLATLKNENSDTLNEWLENHMLECIGKSDAEVSEMYMSDIITRREFVLDGEIIFSLSLNDNRWIITDVQNQSLFFDMLIGNMGQMYWEMVDEYGYEAFD